MAPLRWPLDELVDVLRAPGPTELAGRLVVVEPPEREIAAVERAEASARLALVPCVVVAAPGWSSMPDDLTLVDTRVDDDAPARAPGDHALARLVAAVEATPVAASVLALHLRATERRSVADGLVAESAVFSALQAGAEHRAWRAATPVRARRPTHERDDDGARVALDRRGDELHVTLTRPRVRNALDARMRDELLAALAVAEADPSLRVVLRGAGPVFCAGGDLDEFGTAADPAVAHLVRLQSSLAAVLHRLARRTTVHLHGACAGSGVELAAFAGRVVADPDTTVRLPELGLGLLPGAGGTVSLPRRIGRHRTAWLALTGTPVDAVTARAWGLVDEIALV